MWVKIEEGTFIDGNVYCLYGLLTDGSLKPCKFIGRFKSGKWYNLNGADVYEYMTHYFDFKYVNDPY